MCLLLKIARQIIYPPLFNFSRRKTDLFRQFIFIWSLQNQFHFSLPESLSFSFNHFAKRPVDLVQLQYPLIVSLAVSLRDRRVCLSFISNSLVSLCPVAVSFNPPIESVIVYKSNRMTNCHCIDPQIADGMRNKCIEISSHKKPQQV